MFYIWYCKRNHLDTETIAFSQQCAEKIGTPWLMLITDYTQSHFAAGSTGTSWVQLQLRIELWSSLTGLQSQICGPTLISISRTQHETLQNNNDDACRALLLRISCLISQWYARKREGERGNPRHFCRQVSLLLCANRMWPRDTDAVPNSNRPADALQPYRVGFPFMKPVD